MSARPSLLFLPSTAAALISRARPDSRQSLQIAPLFTLFIERLFRVPMKVNLETVASLLTIIFGVVLYHFHSIGFTSVGLVAICLNMAFAVFERLMQRHLMAQQPVDVSKPGMMLLNNACGLLPCTVLLIVYQEPARWGQASEEMTAGGTLFVLASCLNGLAISYAGLRVQQLVTATTFMVLTCVSREQQHFRFRTPRRSQTGRRVCAAAHAQACAREVSVLWPLLTALSSVPRTASQERK